MARTKPTQTPMMRQYARIKAEYPDCLLLYHMGDFYELFGQDAVHASRILNLTLTSRNKDAGKDAVPMCGVPCHSADSYIEKLIRAGWRVAVCDQVEDPRQAKGLVKRDVTRVVSAGTVLEDRMLEDGANNYLAAVCRPTTGGVAGLAYVDLSTGEFVLGELAARELDEELARLRPAEILVMSSRVREEREAYRGRAKDAPAAQEPSGNGKSADDADRSQETSNPEDTSAVSLSAEAVITSRDDDQFSADNGHRALLKHLNVGTLAGFGCEDMPLALGAAGAILHYLQETQRSALGHISRVRRLDVGAFVSLDPATIRNLELVESASSRWNGTGRKQGSLLGTLDRTRTALGARELRRWLLRPLRRVDEIRRRQGAVAELVEDVLLRASVREALSGIQDVERLAARVATGRANARDLRALAQSLQKAPAVGEILTAHTACGPALADVAERLAAAQNGPDGGQWVDEVLTTLDENCPAGLRDGGLIRDGIDGELDRLRAIRSGGKDWIAALQRQEQERTGIPTLKVGYNKVFGYYLEVTHTHRDKTPDDYIRKQTLANAERFVTPELKEREAEVLGAEDKITEREHELFVALREHAAAHVAEAQTVAAAVAELDALASLAETAERLHYVCPDIDDGRTVEVEGGRHPTLEAQLPRGEFVPNDLRLDGDGRQIVLVTGPNMAGKSTYIRSAALWVLMAQIGSFVPADSARIGVADRIFTRVGASDDLGRGQSTFMVEMVETARILNAATDASLVVLDEIGRGTSTFDGVAIAWAVVEALHERDGARPRTLFATHYHELTELARSLPRVDTCNVAVREWQGEITFLHKIVAGAADRSYGIHVARLAGVPQEVVDRAWEILEVLEKKTGGAGTGVTEMAQRARKRKKAMRQVVQLPLFGAAESETLKKLAELDANSLAPLDALKLLDELARQARDEVG